MDRALDPRSNGLQFNNNSDCWSSVEVSDKLLISYCLLLPSSKGLTKIEWPKLPAYLYMYGIYAVFSQGRRLLRWCVSYTGKVMVGCILYRYQTLNYLPLPLPTTSYDNSSAGEIVFGVYVSCAVNERTVQSSQR